MMVYVTYYYPFLEKEIFVYNQSVTLMNVNSYFLIFTFFVLYENDCASPFLTMAGFKLIVALPLRL